MRRILLSIVFTVAALWPWVASAQQPPANCSTTSQNLWVRDQLNTYYYWYQHLPSNVSPADFNSPEAYLEAVRFRPIDNYYSYITTAAANDAFYSDSQFIGFGFGQQTTTTEIRVLQVYDASPALEAGLTRGDRITHVNGQSVESMVLNGTIGNAFGLAEIGVAAEIRFVKPAGEERSARMVKRLVTIPTVSLTHVVDVDGRKVGYLFFRNFVRPSAAALNDAFAALKAAGATELVLDLRYNGGGLVDIAVQLASLIGGTRTSGQVMINWVHNDRIGPIANRVTRYNETPEQTLNLERLVVITTRSSASASELIINSLRPYIPVAVIGDTTYGKPVGQYSLNFCEKVLVPVAFSLKNVNNEGDFFDGIAPTCTAADDITHQLGDPAEASYSEALTFLRTGACSPRAEGESRRLRALREGAPRPTGWAALLNAQ
ncbi:MAG: S41 family peptidase [Vicinamibacterales bacterium]